MVILRSQNKITDLFMVFQPDCVALNRRGRHQYDLLVTLRMEKQGYLSENHTQDQRGSNLLTYIYAY